MSNIGKRKIQIPFETTINFEEVTNSLIINGPLGNIVHECQKDTKVKITLDYIEIFNNKKSIYGTENALINNCIIGVSQGFKKTLKFVGIGYRVSIQENTLVMKLGYSHDIKYVVPEGISIISPKPDTLILFSSNKEHLGQIVREIQQYKKLDPYKGKGIILENKFIKLKEGKKK